MDEDIALAKKLPYREMAENGWLPPTKDMQEQVTNLRAFFEVVRLSLIHNPQITRIACRKLADTEKSDYALIAWAQKARLEARNMTPRKISVKKLADAIPGIRTMTILDPSVFIPTLTQLLADCGVALVIIPHIGGSFLHGATFYDGSKIVLGLTLRGKSADRFWFSLFHELAHILYDHIGQPNGTTEEDETAADQFACNALIPPADFSSFVSASNFSKDAILRFADAIRIDCGVVVGRLQKEGLVSYGRFNELKTQYK